MAGDTAEPSSTVQSSPFKLSSQYCGTCETRFDSVEERRAHSKSKIHVDNLRRRVALLDPLGPMAKYLPSRAEDHTKQGSSAAPEDGSASEESDVSTESASSGEAPAFDPDQCLFCYHVADDFDDNLDHMKTAHGLLIPDQSRLLVDLDKLIGYLHLVIFGYRECVCCGTQRSNVRAVQQHMTGKGHCRFDISSERSEYTDFYHPISHSDAAQQGEETSPIQSPPAPVQVDDATLRLPSGKILYQRSAILVPDPRRRRPVSAKSEPGGDSSVTPRSARSAEVGAVTKSERRSTTLANQLANLSVGDRVSLVHLSTPEQRAVLARQKREVGRATRATQRLQTRMQVLGNKVVTKTFVNDVPGRPLG